jgi:hypothetical protein
MPGAGLSSRERHLSEWAAKETDEVRNVLVTDLGGLSPEPLLHQKIDYQEKSE